MTGTEFRCPACLATEAETYASLEDRLFGIAPGNYPLLLCRDCRSIFQHPMPDEARIATFYPQRYWWEAGAAVGAFSSLIGELEQSYREFVCLDHVRFLERCAREKAGAGRTLLDIGCGSGLFIHLARRRGFDVAGMDMSRQAIEMAHARYDLEILRGSVGEPLWEGRTFDFVTMFHVLEHLRAPAAALEYAAGLLKPGGSLILQVPNVRSIQALVLGRRWYGLDVPRHLINFSPAGLAALLNRSGFRLVRQARFSLRDNPASIASSLAVWLDPVGRHVRATSRQPAQRMLAEAAYLCLFVLCTVPAAMESLIGRGGTIWVEAKRSRADF